MFDEISLKQNLQYDAKRDVVAGHSDNRQERTPAVVNTALLILISGILKNWIQPVAFTIARTKTSADTIISCRKPGFSLRHSSATKGQVTLLWQIS